MAERNARPATADKVGWNTTPTNPSTDPGGAVRAAGWATNAIPGSDEFNYLQTMWGDFLQWLEGYAAREWGDLAEAGPTGMSVGELLAVVPPVGGSNSRGAAIFSGVTSGATGGGNIYHLCTDGEYGYYVSGGGGAAQTRVVKFTMSSGAMAQNRELYSGNAIACLAVDGEAVFTMGANAADTGLSRWSRTDLDGPTTAGTKYGCVRVVCNGYYAAAVAPTGGLGKVVIYSDVNGTITEDGSYNTGSNLLGVAIDAENAYMVDASTVYSVALATRGLNWSTALPCSSTPNIDGIATDGDRVYACSDRTALTAGGSANIYCLDRVSGSVLWTADIGSTVDLHGLSVDDRYLYTADGSITYQIAKSNPPAVVAHMTTGTVGVLENVCDGISLLTNGATIATFSRYWTQPEKRKLFVRAEPTDPWRMPFHHIVIPA